MLYRNDENKELGKEIQNISKYEKTRYDNTFVQDIKIKKKTHNLRQKLKFIIPSRMQTTGIAKKKK